MPNSVDWRADRVGAAERGENPTVLARMRTGWAVIGDTQHLPGYTLLLYQDPRVDQLTELSRADRAAFLFDLALLGEAVQDACVALDGAFLRVNYEVLGNSLHQLHGHIHARYRWEPDQYRSGPVWRYPDRTWPNHELGSSHDRLRTALTQELRRITAEAYGLPAGASEVGRGIGRSSTDFGADWTSSMRSSRGTRRGSATATTTRDTKIS